MTARALAGKAVIYMFLLVAAAYTLTPIITVAITAVRSEADLNQGPFSLPKGFNGITNFVRAWTVGRIGVYSGNSIAITIPAVLLVLSLTTLGGYSFAKIRFPGRTGLFFLLITGMMVPFQAIMIPIYFLMNFLRLLNTRVGVMLVIAIGGLPFGTFMMRAFFMGVSDELIEAAKLDGCSQGRLFFSLMLPLTYPAWGSLIIFQAMWTWNNFLVPMLFIYDESRRPIPLGLMFFQGRYTSEYTSISAAILIAIVPLVVLYIFFQRRFTTGLVAGALKG